MNPVTTIFWDLGGVLLSNGWDREQRASAMEHFGLDAEDFEDRHGDLAPALETGRLTLAEYLDATVFRTPRSFTAAEFRDYMEAQSTAHPDALQVVRDVARSGRYRLATLNNESRELNEFRIHRFGLTEIFSLFASSCYLGRIKPDTRIYHTALDLTQSDPGSCVFVDDRIKNLEPARALGIRTIHFHGEDGADELRARLSDAGVLF